MRDFSPVSWRDILRVVFKYKFEMLIIFVAAVAIAFGYLLYVDPVYRAETKILVLLGQEKTSAIEANVRSPNVLFTERGQNIKNEIEILTDPSLTYRVMPKLNEWLDNAYRPPESIYQWLKKWAKDGWRFVKEAARAPLYALGLSVKLTPEQRLALAFRTALSANYIEETDFISLTFSWTNPQFAAFAANAYADEYVSSRSEIFKSSDTLQFYVDQIELLEQQLSDIEEQLEAFLEETQISNLDVQTELLLKEISALEQEYVDEDYLLSDLTFKLGLITDTFRDTDEWPEVSEMKIMLPDLTALDKHFYDLQAERAERLEAFTPESREIVSLDEQIAKLRRQKVESLTNVIEPQIQSTANRRNLLADELQKKRDALDALDRRSREYKELIRSRSIIENSYVKYKEKAEDFRIANALSERRITSVLVIGDALPPAKPSFPWNSLVLGMAAFLGLFLAFVYATVAEYFDRTFQSLDDVESMLEVNLLASIPDLEPDKISVQKDLGHAQPA